MKRGSLHRIDIEVDFDLIDAGGVVHHPNYLKLAERARHHALKLASYSQPELWEDGFALAVAENRSRYLKPAQAGQFVRIETRLDASSGTTLEVTQSMYGGLARIEIPPPGTWITVAEGTATNAPKSLIHEVALRLVCVQFAPKGADSIKAPFKPARLPQRLKSALDCDADLG